VVNASRACEKTDWNCTVSGRCCEEDTLQPNVSLPKSTIHGDIIAFLSTGAYNYSMSSNYNRLPKPAMVILNDGEVREIVKRETYEDLVRNDIV